MITIIVATFFAISLSEVVSACTADSPCDLGGSGCTPSKPCGAFQGDCDTDEDCVGDLVCVADAQTGLLSGGGRDDFCQPPPACKADSPCDLGGSGCTPSKPCGAFQGDCDADEDCAGDLVCVADAQTGLLSGGGRDDFCQPPGAEYKLLFRQTAGTYLNPVSKWKSVNSNSPGGPNYSILDQLDQYRGHDGKFTLKLVWPQRDGANYNIWKQSTNPVEDTKSKVAGYEAVDINFTSQRWGGLESGYLHSDSPDALLDGSVNHGYWYYAVGSKSAWRGAIPGAADAEKVVELYVKVPANHAGCKETLKKNVDVVSGRFKRVPDVAQPAQTLSDEACAELCRNTNTCEYFVRLPSTGDCYRGMGLDESVTEEQQNDRNLGYICKRKPKADYAKGAKGGNNCPPGYGPIWNHDECKEAAKALDASLHRTPSGSWGHVPPYCSYQSGGDQSVHYNNKSSGNKNDGGYTPICKRQPKELTGGDSWLEFGNWRVGVTKDGAHFSFCHKVGNKRTAMIFRNDGQVFPGPRNDFCNWDLPYVNDERTPTNVYFGDRWIQFGLKWRIGETDKDHASIAYQTDKGTAMIWRQDGTRHSGPRDDFSTWKSANRHNFNVNVQYGREFGGFVQFGDWRMGATDANHFSIWDWKTDKTAVIYRNDGTVHDGKGQRTDWNHQAKPIGNLSNTQDISLVNLKSTPKAQCHNPDLLKKCENWGPLSKHRNGCRAFANGWKKKANGCHSCSSTRRDYSACDQAECTAFCNEMYRTNSNEAKNCMKGCNKYAELLEDSTAQVYAKGHRGANACPPGYDPIKSHTECKEAAKALDASLHRTPVGSWGHVPPYCSYQSGGDKSVHYNQKSSGNNDGGYTPICKRKTEAVDKDLKTAIPHTMDMISLSVEIYNVDKKEPGFTVKASSTDNIWKVEQVMTSETSDGQILGRLWLAELEHDKTCAIVVRGTPGFEQLKTLMQNLDSASEDLWPGGQYKVTKGYQDHILDILARNKNKYKLYDWLQKCHDRGYKKILTGHSLGGSVATWLSIHLETMNKESLRADYVVTFGAPRVVTTYGSDRCPKSLQTRTKAVRIVTATTGWLLPIVDQAALMPGDLNTNERFCFESLSLDGYGNLLEHDSKWPNWSYEFQSNFIFSGPQLHSSSGKYEPFLRKVKEKVKSNKKCEEAGTWCDDWGDFWGKGSCGRVCCYGSDWRITHHVCKANPAQCPAKGTHCDYMGIFADSCMKCCNGAEWKWDWFKSRHVCK